MRPTGGRMRPTGGTMRVPVPSLCPPSGVAARASPRRMRPAGATMRVSAPAPARAMRRAAPGRGSAAEQRALLRLGVQRTASSLSLSRARVLRARAAGQGPPRPRVRVCVWGRITAGKAVLLFRNRAGPPSPALFPSGAGSFPAAPVAWRPPADAADRFATLRFPAPRTSPRVGFERSRTRTSRVQAELPAQKLFDFSVSKAGSMSTQ